VTFWGYVICWVVLAAVMFYSEFYCDDEDED
jgi:hypothetical protein